jgi:hypothetical protein
MMLHLLCYQGFAVDDYDFTLDAADMGHPELSLNRGHTMKVRPPLKKSGELPGRRWTIK